MSAASDPAARRHALEVEIAFCSADARRLRDEIAALRLKAEQFERHVDRLKRELHALASSEHTVSL